MTRRVSESGFTLIEVLVASMLMGMLITILTMVFNSSSIAWSTGKAGVAEMDSVRNNMAAASMVADNAVPRVDLDDSKEWGLLVGPWDRNGVLRQRAVVKIKEDNVAGPTWSMMQMDSPIRQANGQTGPGGWVRDSGRFLWASIQPGNVQLLGSAKAYIVGVWSVGPDGKENTGDDISTWPDLD